MAYQSDFQESYGGVSASQGESFSPVNEGESQPTSVKQRTLIGGVAFALTLMLIVNVSNSITDVPASQAVQTAVQNVATDSTVQSLASAISASVGATVGARAATGDVATVVPEIVLHFSLVEYEVIYNMLSFVFAAMGAATIFFWFQCWMVAKPFRTALLVSSLVTLIAAYHYLRIFNSFTSAYTAARGADGITTVTATGAVFNDAYRYVDWLLTVPLLLMELILVMQLPPKETFNMCLKLGSLAAIMVILGYPGEISTDSSTRWVFWALAMIPFIIIVYTLFVSLRDSIADQPESARELVSQARYITVISWCTYPIIFVFPMLGLSGAGAATAIQVGYSVADVIAKPILGLVVWKIALAKGRSADSLLP
jgi:bacteriorhodopsin